MRILKKIMVIVSLSALFILSGCQENNSDVVAGTPVIVSNPTNPSVSIIMSTTSSKVTSNNQIVNVQVRAIDDANVPYTKGNIKIIYPNDVRLGRDVGRFAAINVALDNGGIADFIYTAPDDLLSDKSNIEFAFYHDSNPANAIPYTIYINPDQNQTHIDTKYNLEINPFDGLFTINLESSKAFVTRVADKDGKDITEGNYTIENLNPLLGTLYDNSNAKIDSTDIFTSKDVNFRVDTGKTSGTMPLKVNVTFIDANGDVENLEKVFNLTIFSGPPTAMSISYVATGQDAGHSQFIEEFSIKLTDKYNNYVNTRPMIQVGAIAGYAKDQSVYPAIKAAADATTNGTYTKTPASADFNVSKLYNGNLIALRSDADISNHSATYSKITIGNSMNYDITNFDKFNNVIVTFGNGYRYQKSGKWDIESVDTTTDEFILKDKYDKVSAGFDMGFAIGNNFRQDTCKYGREWVLTTESADGTYQVDRSGFARIKMPYDYYLAGKDIVVYANLIGNVLGNIDETVRVGEAIKATLRGHGLHAEPNAGYTIAAGAPMSPGYKFSWRLKDTQEWHRNGHAGGYALKTTGGAHCQNPVYSDYRNCVDEGTVTVSYSCQGGGEDGTIILSDGFVATELVY